MVAVSAWEVIRYTYMPLEFRLPGILGPRCPQVGWPSFRSFWSVPDGVYVQPVRVAMEGILIAGIIAMFDMSTWPLWASRSASIFVLCGVPVSASISTRCGFWMGLGGGCEAVRQPFSRTASRSSSVPCPSCFDSEMMTLQSHGVVA